MLRMLLALLLCASSLAAQSASTPDYRIGVVSESGDIVTWLVPADSGLLRDRVVPVGIMPADIDGPHNITASADGRFYYVSIAHGVPYGTLWKMAVDGDTLVGRAPLELFPTTIALTPDGELAFVANSDFHGDHPRVNVVSVVHTPTMTTIVNLPACDMPHGVKSNHAGTLVYVSCMHSDELLEIDVANLAIARRVPTGTGNAMDHSGEGHCSPTYVSVSPDDRQVYLACNHGNTLQIRDAVSLRLLSEVPAGAGAYNVGASPDGRFVVVTNKKDQSVSVIDPRAGSELARVPVTKPVVHGVAFSPDGRYAYISAESVGADPGAVDVLDLASLQIIATIPVPAQPTGITIVTVPGPE